MFRRGMGTKNDKFSHRSMKMKEIMRIYLCKVSDIGSKKCYKDDSVIIMVKW